MSAELFTNIKIYPVKKENPVVKANGSVLVAGVVEVKFTILNGAKGMFVVLPSKQGIKPDKEGKKPYYPDAWFPDKEVNKKFQKVVLDEFQGLSKNLSAQSKAGEESQVPEDSSSAGYSDDVPF